MKTSSASNLRFLSASIIAVLLSSCLSVSITPKVSKAEDVKLSAPQGAFAEIKSPGADQAWQDKNLGNSISYLSSCNDPADPSLESIERDMLSSLESAKILNTSQEFFDGRESRRTQAEGNVDGIATKIEILTFKKNNCLYSVSYVAITKNFDQDLGAFHKFLEGFKAP